MENSRDQLKLFESTLDAYAISVGLDKIIYNTDVDDILLMDYDQLKLLDKQGCEEYAYLLQQYSLVLSKEYNRQSVRVMWAQDKINQLIAAHYNHYVGDRMMKYDLVYSLIINNDTAAQEMNRIIIHAKARQLELTDMSKHMDSLSRILSNIARSK